MTGGDNSKRSWDLALIQGMESRESWTEAPRLPGGRGALIPEQGVVAGSRAHRRCGPKSTGGEGGLARRGAAAARGSICTKKGSTWSCWVEKSHCAPSVRRFQIDDKIHVVSGSQLSPSTSSASLLSGQQSPAGGLAAGSVERRWVLHLFGQAGGGPAPTRSQRYRRGLF